MLEHFLKLARKSAVYLLATGIPVFLGVLLLPLYTRFLTPEEYGITSVAASVTAFLSIFCQLGLLAAYLRFYFDYRQNGAELKRLISTVTIFLTLYGLVLSTTITLFGQPLEMLIPGVAFSPYIQMAVWSSYFSLIFMLRLGLYQAEQKANKYLLFSAAQIAVTTVLTILLVVFLKQGALGYIGAQLVSNAIFSVVSLWLLRQHLALIVDPTKLKAALRYGLPLIFHSLGAWMYSAADRLLLNDLVGTAETGLYTVGFQVGQAVNLIASVINFAWSPYFFSLMADRGDAAKGEVGRFTTYWVMAMCFVFLLISVFSRELVALLAAAPYREAYRVVPLVALGFLFGGLYYVVVNPLFWLGKTRIIATGTLTSGVLNVALNLTLIPQMQMMGAALATALSSLYCFLFIAFFSLRLFPVPYEYRRLVKISIATVACYLLSLAVADPGGFRIVFAAKLAIVILFPALIIFLRFLDSQEKRAVKDFFQAGVQWCYGKMSLRKGNKSP